MSDDMQRLLVEQAAYYSGRDSEAERITELEAENAWLREALTDLVNADAGDFNTMHPDLARQRARAALAHSEDA
jgi:hypothetical protein